MHNCQLTEKLVEDLSEDQNVHVAKEYPGKQDMKHIGIVAVGVAFVIACCVTLANF